MRCISSLHLGFALLLLVSCNQYVHQPYHPIIDPVVDTLSTDTVVIPVNPIDSVIVNPEPENPDFNEGTGVVLVVGGGASGVSAGLQAARMGMETIIVEESPWLGGMLTAAGVTATDGCYNLRAGIFAEFTDELANYYGSYNSLKTGWVSNILFEPHVGEQIFERFCKREENLTVVKETRFESLSKKAKGWTVNFISKDGSSISYDCDVLIDCTELGDVAKAAGVKYRVGMDSKEYGGESAAIGPNDVVQDLTMVMTLKNYGRDVTIEKPAGYNESKYVNSCKNSLNVPSNTGQSLQDPGQMMSYGLCPKGKYMINWPTCGNDYYANIIEMSREEREAEIAKAKLHSLGFLYFLQTRLGYRNLGLADDEYPSEDLFPFYPYHRESRRIEGEYLFTVDEAASTFISDGYRTGIAVGDYPVDHHHHAHPDWASYKIDFPKIIPFSVPLGCLVPQEVEDLIVAEKSISVTNLANGTTRLQPVVVELGQAAGAMAVTAIKRAKSVRKVNVREVQQYLLDSKALLMPYRDCLSGDNDFQAIQKIGATGVMRGFGQTVGWSNECHFQVMSATKWSDLYLEDYYGIAYNPSSSTITGAEFLKLLETITGTVIEDFPDADAQTITRRKAARYLDKYADPFSRKVDWSGKLVSQD